MTRINSRIDFAALLQQRGRMLQLQCAGPALALVPERLVMREAVNQPFELVVDCIALSAGFELKTLLGEPITVGLLQADGAYKPWHGYVFEVAQLGSDGAHTRYRLLVRPWLAFLDLRRDARVFIDNSTQAIVEQVFGRYAFANFRFALNRELRVRSLCTQYRESDLAFVQRLLAEEGLSWHFEHLAEGSDDGRAHHVLVIGERDMQRPDLGPVRFAGRHRSANVFGQKDAVTAFMAQRQVQANAVTLGSWNYKALAGSAASDASALPVGELPRLEVYDGSGAYRFHDAEHAAEAAALALAALELDFERFEGQGGARHFEAGRRFQLIDHPRFGANTTALNYPGALLHESEDNAFVILAVEHHATNNLGVQAAELLGLTELEQGSYVNHFHAARAATPVVARRVPRPTAHGLQTALVVGIANEAVTTERDLRVQVRFAWQRSAPGDDSGGTWVRVAQAAAGANWGQVFVPRLGAEVAIAFVEGDIDRPVVVGGVYNGQDTPPFAAGHDSGVNHPGVIDGWHSRALDGAGFNEWVLDNASGQLRMRLHASYASSELGLGHLIQQGPASAQRGAWRGAGFEANTQGWVSLRAGNGMLLSASARAGTYGSAQSTQMDAGEALAQLKAARELGSRLSEAAKASTAAPLHSHDAGQALDSFIKAIDPRQDGRHAGPVNGQQAKKASGRSWTDPVEAFDKPLVVLDAPSTTLWASDASIASFAGQDFSLVVQGDVQHTAAHTFASVSGQTTSWYTHAGGAKVYAANGPVSVQAHTDSLQILADKEVTVTSVNDAITISAKSRIELVAGQSSIVLDGGNIEFGCPGTWQAQASMHAFLGGGSYAAALPMLPDGTSALTHEIELNYTYDDLSPVKGAPFKLLFQNGQVIEGRLDAQGKATVPNTPPYAASVEFGEDERTESDLFVAELKNPLFGMRPSSTKEATALLERFCQAEREHLEDYLFDDEIAELQEIDGFDHDAYEDYLLDGEEPPAPRAYRTDHPLPAANDAEEQA